MKKKTVISIISVTLLLFLCSFSAAAERAVFVNGNGMTLGGLFSNYFAVGRDGVLPLAYDDVYVLTSHGADNISSMNAEGGGGLLYDNGTVEITSNIIKVGLSFNFNRAESDTTVDSAQFTNNSGGGFAFGYYDNDRCFVELGSTVENTLLILPIPEQPLYVGVYTLAGELIHQTTHPNTKDNLIALHPLSDSGDALTSYLNYRYYGDFEIGYTAGEGITVINTVDIEQYIKGVIAVEMPALSPLEAYKAQAVAARSYAQRCIKNTDLYDYYGFDVTNNTYYQAYYGHYTVSQSNYGTISDAVEQTRNEYLTYNGNVINAMYCAANGGETLDGGYPYLKGFADPYESAAWTRGPLGHRVGMSQWGAYSMAKYKNKDYKSILGFYYTKVGISTGYV